MNYTQCHWSNCIARRCCVGCSYIPSIKNGRKTEIAIVSPKKKRALDVGKQKPRIAAQPLHEWIALILDTNSVKSSKSPSQPSSVLPNMKLLSVFCVVVFFCRKIPLRLRSKMAFISLLEWFLLMIFSTTAVPLDQSPPFLCAWLSLCAIFSSETISVGRWRKLLKSRPFSSFGGRLR